MKPPKATARFQDVLAASGRPEPLTLWGNLKQDAPFKTARDEHRILTVKQETVGTKKDYGIVGFQKEKNVSYWVFPKSLEAFAGKKIVGIKYDLLQSEQGFAAGAVPTAPRIAKGKSRKSGVVKRPREKAPLRYRVTMRCSATVQVTREVEARSSREAQDLAAKQTAHDQIDFSRAQFTCKAIETTPLKNRSTRLAARLRQLRA